MCSCSRAIRPPGAASSPSDSGPSIIATGPASAARRAANSNIISVIPSLSSELAVVATALAVTILA